ncbi:MAG: LpqB family beta-propeller domain-containing protein [Maricaulaceae bacterium]
MRTLLSLIAGLTSALGAAHAEVDRFAPRDVFDLEVAFDPQIAPDGTQVVYVRRSMDIMTDGARQRLWSVNADGSDHQPLALPSDQDAFSPRWSPSGDRLAYVSVTEEGPELHVMWMATGATAQLTQLEASPGSIAWAPDGRSIAFTQFVKDAHPSPAPLPAKPEGADWAEPVKVIDRLDYRFDGRGFTDPGATQVFIVPAEGGAPLRLTEDAYDYDGLEWTPDGAHLIAVANRQEKAEIRDPNESEIHTLAIETGVVSPLTDRDGPDTAPSVSPDGQFIAFTGYDDDRTGHNVTQLYVMDADGSNVRALTADLERDITNPQWSADGAWIYVQFDDEGDTVLARIAPEGGMERLASNLGGYSLGRPYGGASYSLAEDGTFASVTTRFDRPADLIVGAPGETPRQLTQLNEDLLGRKDLGAIEEFVTPSRIDGLGIEAWAVFPPGFDPEKRYPLILEIHGGPYANYGPRFSAEVQLYAAAGAIVVYANPRGSTSYGEAFGDEINNNYPNEDFDDLMSLVDAMAARDYVDSERLFVTGGSGGGVLTAWIVGHTNRFAAAAVQKPVINWLSFALSADISTFVSKYWFDQAPWEDPEGYWARSPLAYVGDVETPTLLITGEADWRTPIWESEQFYHALQLREVPSRLIRVPGASHGIANRPSQLLAKVQNILAWFEAYGLNEATDPEPETSAAP